MKGRTVWHPCFIRDSNQGPLVLAAISSNRYTTWSATIQFDRFNNFKNITKKHYLNFEEIFSLYRILLFFSFFSFFFLVIYNTNFLKHMMVNALIFKSCSLPKLQYLIFENVLLGIKNKLDLFINKHILLMF